MRAAAAMTSITMKGGTSLRAEGVSRLFTWSLSVDSCIEICYCAGAVQIRVPNLSRPRLAVFSGLL
jgi:hypothetical protein